MYPSPPGRSGAEPVDADEVLTVALIEMAIETGRSLDALYEAVLEQGQATGDVEREPPVAT